MKPIIFSILLALSVQPAFAAEASKAKQQTINLDVTENGFEPAKLHAEPGIPTVLKITRKTDATCAKAISIPEKKIKVDLPLNKAVAVKLGKLKTGDLRFVCGMKMLDGAILVE